MDRDFTAETGVASPPSTLLQDLKEEESEEEHEGRSSNNIEYEAGDFDYAEMKIEYEAIEYCRTNTFVDVSETVRSSQGPSLLLNDPLSLTTNGEEREDVSENNYLWSRLPYCVQQCHVRITQVEQKRIFDDYWKEKTYDSRLRLVGEMIKKSDPCNHKSLNVPKFYLTTSTSRKEICRNCLRLTLNESEHFIAKVLAQWWCKFNNSKKSKNEEFSAETEASLQLTKTPKTRKRRHVSASVEEPYKIRVYSPIESIKLEDDDLDIEYIKIETDSSTQLSHDDRFVDVSETLQSSDDETSQDPLSSETDESDKPFKCKIGNWTPLPPCEEKCEVLITEEEQKSICNLYWRKRTQASRLNFLNKMTKMELEVRYGLQRYVAKYYFNTSQGLQEFCRECFRHILDENDKFITTVLERKMLKIKGASINEKIPQISQRKLKAFKKTDNSLENKNADSKFSRGNKPQYSWKRIRRCSNKCNLKIKEYEQKQIFNDYWENATFDSRFNFISNMIEFPKNSRRRNKAHFYLHSSEGRKQVCRLCFRLILSESSTMITEIVKKKLAANSGTEEKTRKTVPANIEPEVTRRTDDPDDFVDTSVIIRSVQREFEKLTSLIPHEDFSSPILGEKGKEIRRQTEIQECEYQQKFVDDSETRQSSDDETSQDPILAETAGPDLSSKCRVDKCTPLPPSGEKCDILLTKEKYTGKGMRIQKNKIDEKESRSRIEMERRNYPILTKKNVDSCNFPRHIIKPPAKWTQIPACAKNCHLRLKENDQRLVFNEYWNYSTNEERLNLLYNMLELVEKPQSMNIYVASFYLYTDGGRKQVCRVCFARILGEQEGVIESMMQHKIHEVKIGKKTIESREGDPRIKSAKTQNGCVEVCEIIQNSVNQSVSQSKSISLKLNTGVSCNSAKNCDRECLLLVKRIDQNRILQAYRRNTTENSRLNFVYEMTKIVKSPLDQYDTRYYLNVDKGRQEVCKECFRIILDEREAFVELVLQRKLREIRKFERKTEMPINVQSQEKVLDVKYNRIKSSTTETNLDNKFVEVFEIIHNENPLPPKSSVQGKKGISGRVNAGSRNLFFSEIDVPASIESQDLQIQKRTSTCVEISETFQNSQGESDNQSEWSKINARTRKVRKPKNDTVLLLPKRTNQKRITYCNKLRAIKNINLESHKEIKIASSTTEFEKVAEKTEKIPMSIESQKEALDLQERKDTSFGKKFLLASNSLIICKPPRPWSRLNSCLEECNTRVKENEQKRIYDAYWLNTTKKLRFNFVNDMTDMVESPCRSSLVEFKYYLGVSEVHQEVCRLCFRRTIAESNDFITMVLEYKIRKAKNVTCDSLRKSLPPKKGKPLPDDFIVAALQHKLEESMKVKEKPEEISISIESQDFVNMPDESSDSQNQRDPLTLKTSLETDLDNGFMQESGILQAAVSLKANLQDRKDVPFGKNMDMPCNSPQICELSMRWSPLICCPEECNALVDENEQKRIFDAYWLDATEESRFNFVSDMTDMVESPYRKNLMEFNFYLGVSEGHQEVCRLCFRRTIAESNDFITLVLEHKARNTQSMPCGSLRKSLPRKRWKPRVLPDCRQNCHLLINENDHKRIFESYWEKATNKTRFNFVNEMTKMVQSPDSGYDVEFYLNMEGGSKKVCGNCFCIVLGERDDLIEAILEHKLRENRKIKRKVNIESRNDLKIVKNENVEVSKKKSRDDSIKDNKSKSPKVHVHTSKKTDPIRNRSVSCHSVRKCLSLIEEIEQKRIHDQYWHNATETSRFNFVNEMVEMVKSPIDQYDVRFYLNTGPSREEFCRACFRIILGEGNYIIISVLEHKLRELKKLENPEDKELEKKKKNTSSEIQLIKEDHSESSDADPSSLKKVTELGKSKDEKLETKKMKSSSEIELTKVSDSKSSNDDLSPLKKVSGATRLHKCKNKCFLGITENDQKENVHSYQQQRTFQSKFDFINDRVDSSTFYPAGDPNNEEHENKNFNANYYIKTHEGRKKVCSICFQHIFKNSEYLIMSVFEKQYYEHGKRIEEQINKISLCGSQHYNVPGSEKYLPIGLTLEILYELYKIEVSDPLLSFNFYLKVLALINLKDKPKLGKCEKCESAMEQAKLSHRVNKKNKITDLETLHTFDANCAEKHKSHDEKVALSINSLVVCSFGFQHSLPTPFLSDFKAFYKRPLWTFNFTIHQVSGHSEVARNTKYYMWNETQGKKTVNEIASCLYHYLRNLPEEVKHVIFYSNSCNGQSRSTTISRTILHVLTNHKTLEIVEHKFLVDGHSEIEKNLGNASLEIMNMSRGKILEPNHWYNAFSIKRIDNETNDVPEVVVMTKEMFYDFESLWKNKIPYFEEDIKWCQYTKKGVVYYKENWQEYDCFKVLNLIGYSDIKYCDQLCNLGNFPIAAEKKKDLLDVLQLVPSLSPEIRKFYESLPVKKSSDEESERILEERKVEGN